MTRLNPLVGGFNWLDSGQQTYSCCWAVKHCGQQYAGTGYQWLKPHIVILCLLQQLTFLCFKLLQVNYLHRIWCVECWLHRNVMALMLFYIVQKSTERSLSLMPYLYSAHIHTKDCVFGPYTQCRSFHPNIQELTVSQRVQLWRPTPWNISHLFSQ